MGADKLRVLPRVVVMPKGVQINDGCLKGHQY